MKRVLVSAMAAIAAWELAASPAATQSWVANYVATNTVSSAAMQQWVMDYVATNSTAVGTIVQSVTNGLATMVGIGDAGNTNDWVAVSIEYPDKLALVATNVTATGASMGVTNGMIFAWNGNGEFWNAPTNLFIQCVSNECFKFNGIKSTQTNGVDAFIGCFSVVGTKITRSAAAALLPATDSVSSVRKNFFDFLCELVFPSAMADTWGDIGDYYTPVITTARPDVYAWEVEDSRGNVATANFVSDESGFYCTNEKEVLDSLTYSVKSVMGNMLDLASGLTTTWDTVIDMDKRIDEFDAKISKTLSDVVKQLNKLQTTAKSPTSEGGMETVTIEKRVEVKNNYIITASTDWPVAAGVDGRSISTTGSGKDKKYKLYNFPSWSNASVGKIPFYSSVKNGGALNWYAPKDDYDDNVFGVDTDSTYNNLIMNIGDKHGIHLAGWYSPTEGSHACNEKLVDIMTNSVPESSSTHYVLTQHKSNQKLHYMEIGKLASTIAATGGGSALKVVGTEDANSKIIGSGSVTNVLKFTSFGDSNVKVAVGDYDDDPAGDGIEIKIGVYWKQ